MKCLVFSLVLLTAVFSHAASGKFEFQDKDRVVVLGGTFVEREQQFGFMETALTLGAENKVVSFRNLGWSGDTVFGHARSYFGPPKEGLERLGKHLDMLKPTVLISCYGSDLPFEGMLKLPDFLSGYRDLLELVRSKSPHLRVVIVAPAPFENLGAPQPDLTAANAKLKEVRDALKEFAAQQNATFVDGFAIMGGETAAKPAKPLTDNGLHYGADGYRLWATKMTEALGFPKVDFSNPDVEALRQVVVKKDENFFHRWRPANETYLYGFRKHEQGQNAAEIEQFDPLVEAQEKKIAELKAAILSRKLP